MPIQSMIDIQKGKRYDRMKEDSKLKPNQTYMEPAETREDPYTKSNQQI